MARRVKLLFCIHNHQPGGNFPEVVEEAFQSAYRPLIEAFSRHGSLRLCLHFSGFLYEYLEEHHPDFLDLVGDLIERGQVELLSGPFYEPILTLISEEDVKDQITKSNEFINQRFGVKPGGMWLPERVWGPRIVRPVQESGIKYTVLDDSHFYMAGLLKDQLDGYYITEETWSTLAVFPISQKLRYLIPGCDVRQTIEYLRQLDTDSREYVVCFADDGEKMGLWPGSRERLYEEGWVEDFLTALEQNSEWIESVTFSEVLENVPARGRIYIPNSSYREMTIWSLPVETQLRYSFLENAMKENGVDEEDLRAFLHGGFFRNFLVKYPESNRMHKKMAEIGKKIRNISSEHLQREARDCLFRGQCNCAYWHGTFGGLYLKHLRHYIYKNLIRAEKLVEERKFYHEVNDFLANGFREIKLSNGTLNLYVSPREGGTLYELDILPLETNILDTVARRPEAYHPVPDTDDHSDADLFPQKFRSKLVYDWYNKLSFIDHFISRRTVLDDVICCRFADQGKFVNANYMIGEITQTEEYCRLHLFREAEVWTGTFRKMTRIDKIYQVERNNPCFTLGYRVKNVSDTQLFLRMAVECNISTVYPDDCEKTSLAMLSAGREQVIPAGGIGEIIDVTRVIVRNPAEGYNLTFDFKDPLMVWNCPIETVNRSEKGIELNYQGNSLFFVFHFTLDPGQQIERTFRQTIDIIERRG